MEGLEQGAVFLAAVSLFLCCLMCIVLPADLCIPRLPLIALLGAQGSGLLAGVHLFSCILICVLAHSLSQQATVSEEHLISSAPLPEACGQEQEEKGLKRGRFAPCHEDKIGEGLRTISGQCLLLYSVSGRVVRWVLAPVLLRELEAGPVDPAASLLLEFPT